MATTVNRIKVNTEAYTNVSENTSNCTIIMRVGTEAIRVVIGEVAPEIEEENYVLVKPPEQQGDYNRLNTMLSVEDLVKAAPVVPLTTRRAKARMTRGRKPKTMEAPPGDSLWVRADQGEVEITVARGTAKLAV